MFPSNELDRFYDWILILIIIESLKLVCQIFLLRAYFYGDPQQAHFPLKCIGFSMDNAWILWEIYGNIMYYNFDSVIHKSFFLSIKE